VFRGSDPSIWNQHIRVGANRWTIPIDKVSHPIRFVRLLRVDTGESVTACVDKSTLLRCCDNLRPGLNEQFSGGHHLGICHRHAPPNVEVRDGQGGWGFGHSSGEHDRQAFGWAGHALPKTVFEVSVLEKLPSYLRHELLD